MEVRMTMPQMGESIVEATILKWLRLPGDRIEKDESIVEISTDKVDSEIPAPASGVLKAVLAKEGEIVAVHADIAVIETEAGKEERPEKESEARAGMPTQAEAEAVDLLPHEASSHQKFSPLARSLAREEKVRAAELEAIRGSGAGGRVTKSDVQAYLLDKDKSGAEQPFRPEAEEADSGAEGAVAEPLSEMRKKIAAHMSRSKAVSPHAYSVAEADVTAAAEWREKHQQAFTAREGFKLSFTPFFLEAVVNGLRAFPRINASLQEDALLLKKEINLGCAVALGEDGSEGLIVPVIRDADRLNLTGLARALHDLGTRARAKRLKTEDVQGGTFTITNPGVFGNIMSFPIINQPQLAILGIGAIKKRAAAVNGAVAVRDIVYLTLAYDHRAIDGALSGAFLRFVTAHLEGWPASRNF